MRRCKLVAADPERNARLLGGPVQNTENLVWDCTPERAINI